MEVAIVFGTVCLATAAYKFGIKDKVTNWFCEKKRKAGIVLSLFENVTNNTASFTVNDTNTSATILYNRLGKKAIVFVPYSRVNLVGMIPFKTELIRENQPSLVITQQPGIPYLVSARNLGGTHIKITNQETGDIKYFGKDEIPGYVTELYE